MKKRIGLALSGGGFRAAAFHLGTLNKLHELGVLSQVDVLSTISGGSITGAYYNLHGQDYNEFKKELYEKLSSVNVVREVLVSRRFVIVNLALLSLLIVVGIFSKIALIVLLGLLLVAVVKWQFKIMPVSKMVEVSYRRHFFGEAALKDLSAAPLIAINATNLQTGRLFTFSRTKMGDSSYTYGPSQVVRFKHSEFPVATAVMASSCVPQFFTPVSIPREFYENNAHYDACRPVLVDGGIYDNQGIHKLTQPGSSYECDIIITSDAGNKLLFDGRYNNTFTVLVRTSEVLMQRIKFIQMMKNIYHPSARALDKDITYFSLGWDLENCISGFVDALRDGLVKPEVIGLHKIPPEMVTDVEKFRAPITRVLEDSVGYRDIIERNLTEAQHVAIRGVTTNLTPIKKPTLDLLIRFAENLTELQVKLYLPHSLLTNGRNNSQCL